MESLVSVNCTTIECTSLSPTAPIWQDVLAQAMTGELIAAMNYTSLSEICDDPEEADDAREHAVIERGHAARFAAEGRKIGVEVANNVDAKHWKRLREAFLGCIAARDFIGCLIVQEIMLESFAVASYARVGKVAPGSSGQNICGHRSRRRRARRSRHGDSQSGASVGHAALRGESAPAASRCDDHPREDAGKGMQGRTLRSVSRELREANAVRCPLECGRTSRSVAATVSEDARHAGHTRRSNTWMGGSVAGVSDGLYPDMSSGDDGLCTTISR